MNKKSGEEVSIWTNQRFAMNMTRPKNFKIVFPLCPMPSPSVAKPTPVSKNPVMNVAMSTNMKYLVLS
jgi:hypothetical protein